MPRIVYYDFYTKHSFQHAAILINGKLLICNLYYLYILLYILLQFILISQI
jgi:hypothetical protein